METERREDSDFISSELTVLDEILMDAFESEMQKLDSMDAAQRKLELEKLRADCICPDCPTYNKCAGDQQELLYCVEGKSSCISEELGCICPDCPVAAQFDLVDMYYCTQGSEKEKRQS